MLERNRVLSIVAADPAARAIAASAGLPVYASVAEFEATGVPGARGAAPGAVPDEPPADAPKPTRTRRRATKGADKTAATGAAALGGSAAGGALAGRGGVGEQMSADLLPDGTPFAPTIVAAPRRPEPGSAETRPRSSAATVSVVPNAWSGGLLSGRLAAVLGSGLVVLLILAVIGYVVLPQATVVVTPVAAPIGPITFTVRADPDATSIDATGGVIPATRLSLDFTASGEFPATGKRVVQTKAKGSVTFRNCDTSAGHTIPGGSVVSTATGIGFATSQTIRVATAPISPLRARPRASASSRSRPEPGVTWPAEPSTRSRPASTSTPSS